MILSAMIFAGVTFIVGVVLGFLIGQARSRMNYEEELGNSERAHAALESQLAELRAGLQSNPPNESSSASPAERQGEEIKR